MSGENTNDMERSRTGRPWDDLCSDLLSSISAKLPSTVDRAEFGSVCRNWRRFYSATADYAAPRSSHDANFTICSFRRGATVTSYPQQLPYRLLRDFAGASVVGRSGSGWWLMSNSAGEIFCCFNPLLQSSGTKSVIEVPRFGIGNTTNPKPRAAFSAPPTDPSSTILVVHGGDGSSDNPTTLSTLLRNQHQWDTHEIRIYRGQTCVAIGYRDGKFFCLFESADVLIFEIDKETGGIESRCQVSVTVLLAVRPLAPGRFPMINYLRAAAKLDEDLDFQVVVSWERVKKGPDGGFRLLTAEIERSAKEELGNWYLDDKNTTTSSERAANWSCVSLVRGDFHLTLLVRSSFLLVNPINS